MPVITNKHISVINGAPIANVDKYWPLIIDELKALDKNKLFFQVPLLCTIAVETGKFAPVQEAYWLGEGARRRWCHKMYDIEGERPHIAKVLGNVKPGDGYKYRGRGFVQLTGRSNYRKYGQALGLDLEGAPNLANAPVAAARILVKFADDHGLDTWGQRAFDTGDNYPEEFCKRKVRRLVNGGYRHYKQFSQAWERYKGVINGA